MRVIVAGHICLDLTPELPVHTAIEPGMLQEIGPMRVGAGGCVYNTGSALAELGVEVRLSARVGDDALGALLADQLRAEGLPANLETTATAATSYSIVLENPNTDRAFWHHVGTCAEFDGRGVELATADALHVGYPSLLPGLVADDATPLIHLLRRARAEGLLTSLDLAVVDPDAPVARLDWRDILERVFPLTDVLSPSIDDIQSALGDASPVTPELVEERAEWAIRSGAGIVALSAGSRGGFVAVAEADRLRGGVPLLARLADDWAGYRGWVPAPRLRAFVSTNGAGDAHSAGLLAALLRGADPRSAAQCAADTAAARIQGLPIRESVPL
ncbi:sugar/nucleoside kinase (ribokinase family) [Microbacterium trichothecenolyticum]|uniref:carbohydrate kinase family protein n=1 Tax=Microbacterium trichothecenolyticum TaxID=69370 RepID=UPI0028543ADC|nr:PfkB family carbohydrate kinase [Microbacterium trichothecenolyticum]MDR7184582.1 sugar/nucleoside kinase (ribokinase family) [Microbacterium trichothecenolyticum]